MASKKEQWKSDLYGDAVRDELEAFAEEGFESIPEDERDKWFTRFKFWGVFQQRTGQESYFMMRLTNANGVLEPGQLRTIAEVARDYATGPVDNPEFGNGWVDLTTRQSIQLHWLELEDIPEIWEQLESVGVTSRSAGGDTMRNITGCPVAGKDTHELVESKPLLDRFQSELREDDALSNMPRKFNISVTGCREGCAQDSINDIGLEPARKEVDGEVITGFNVRVGGGLGSRKPRVARSLDVFVADEERAYEVVRGFVELYHDHGNRDVRARARSRFFVDDWGTEKIRDRLESEYLDFELQSAGEDIRDEYTYNAGRPQSAGKSDHVGVHEQSDGRYYVGLSVAVGRLTAADALELADLADKYGSGKIRLTRRQNPIVMDVPAGALDDLLAEPLLSKHTPEPNPFQRGTVACTGTEFCSLALTETKARTARMLRWLRDNVEVPDDVHQLKIHYSGCTADCGQANTADIGLFGMRAQKDGEMVEAMDIGVGGGIGDEPSFVEWIHQRVPADEVPGAIASLVEAFAAHRTAGQTFRQWVEAEGPDAVAEYCEPIETDFEAPYMHDAKQSWYPFADEDEPPKTEQPMTSD
ncbi:ferredoxin--nitrite reductase [Haloferax mediterranei ATCC 33500]|uniref:Assimilatory ferredoxin-dependent nitrite reductase n=2 Tax=Haloferax mediterranei (strain ATCC 33500 / DSM 1411 / JCM 8866 / NBRC 14739 / NCIMB 2177 / R-4) TaxID=523841 RepID=NASD_HALMT|nr:ferredoxin--nitrite reductase [Haloferax mediterranei]I3R637.1 RecName: Full=Assimilatory ferredoxin-dependent nitrite reductase; Short=NiR; AltName: Full=Ferredoxin:nitrite reductase [Haloferax mediterranei ATCC 33500]AFK19697.1 ferredoxin--nitrite reductase [Haloferax mediterranei ATCC 33500]AHZ23086.1 ferredoxin--nitrite reductase [Haloferax mediterranei ATCC 33500]EMA00019.1 ferredoxin--nitrite reductase [Haloferax mediterranei ATCC 33500]MDX5987560.1 ferredoxin--nitrite reductase [Halo